MTNETKTISVRVPIEQYELMKKLYPKRYVRADTLRALIEALIKRAGGQIV